jgi:spoIIIJ-associated protein
MQVVIKSAKTTDDAVRLALAELKCDRENVKIEILEEPTKGFFGLLGAREAKVKVIKKETPAKEASSDNIRVIEGRRTISSAKQNTSVETARIDQIIEVNTDNKDQQQIFLEKVTAMMGVPAYVARLENDDSIQYILSGEHMGALIGRRGDTLDSLQYLTNIIANKRKDKDHKRIVLDSEGYRSRREDTLFRLAKRLAGRVKRTGHKVVLEPMSPLERRLIHTALQGDPDVKTLSEGEEPYRRIVISPINGEKAKVARDNDIQKIEKKSPAVQAEPKSKIPLTYKSERRFSERPPKRSYTNIEDVDGRHESDGSDGKSTLW